MMRPWRRAIFTLVLSGTLASGCSPFGAPLPEAAEFDLGPLPLVTTPAPGIQRVSVVAPSWLGGTGMAYRLRYQAEAQRREFRDSVWAAAPADLLRQALAQGLTAGSPGACVLKVELDELAWDYRSASSAEAVLQARLALFEPNGATLAAGHVFDARVAVEGRGAAANVAAMRTAVMRLQGDAADWVGKVDVDRMRAAGLNKGRRCR